MTLGDKQEIFAVALQRLLAKAHELGYGVRLRELQRTQEQAQLYAARGMGSANSVHIHSLAIDLYLRVNGQMCWGGEPYKKLAELWKGMASDLGGSHLWGSQVEFCWGGDFQGFYDPYHFSIAHGGVK